MILAGSEKSDECVDCDVFGVEVGLDGIGVFDSLTVTRLELCVGASVARAIALGTIVTFGVNGADACGTRCVTNVVKTNPPTMMISNVRPMFLPTTVKSIVTYAKQE